MSSMYAELLLKRARMFLEAAEVNFSNRRFDVVVVGAKTSTFSMTKNLIKKD